jgi:hypothetical protein
MRTRGLTLMPVFRPQPPSAIGIVSRSINVTGWSKSSCDLWMWMRSPLPDDPLPHQLHPDSWGLVPVPIVICMHLPLNKGWYTGADTLHFSLSVDCILPFPGDTCQNPTGFTMMYL